MDQALDELRCNVCAGLYAAIGEEVPEELTPEEIDRATLLYYQKIGEACQLSESLTAALNDFICALSRWWETLPPETRALLMPDDPEPPER